MSKSNTSFSPLSNDGNVGSLGVGGVLNGAANAAGLTFTLPAGAAASSISVDNPAPYWLRVTQTPAAGVTAAAGFVGQSFLVHPQGSYNASYNGDDQISLVAQFVADPAPGTVAIASAMVPLVTAAVVGSHRVTVNFLNG